MTDSSDTQPLPFCSLDRPALAERIAEIRALVARFGGLVRRDADGVSLAFVAQPGLRPALEALAAKERQCCATLRITVTEGPDGVALRFAGAEDEAEAIKSTLGSG